LFSRKTENMKHGEIKLTLSTFREMESRHNSLLEKILELQGFREKDAQDFKAINKELESGNIERASMKAVLLEIQKSPYAYVGRYFIASDDLDRVAEADFNASFKDFLKTQFRKNK